MVCHLNLNLIDIRDRKLRLQGGAGQPIRDRIRDQHHPEHLQDHPGRVLDRQLHRQPLQRTGRPLWRRLEERDRDPPVPVEAGQDSQLHDANWQELRCSVRWGESLVRALTNRFIGGVDRASTFSAGGPRLNPANVSQADGRLLWWMCTLWERACSVKLS